ncbi:hypothetical protein [Chryseobacterium limigenitum]|nr:hypothetical protein [Chryseobacterium limigenitum]
MNTDAELIFSKELDKNISVECFVSNGNDNFAWEFKIKGKENKTVDKFKINKQKLQEYSPLANRPDFYKQLKVISVFKNGDNLVFLLDKFGQVDAQVYPLSDSGPKTVIPVKTYQLSPMDTELLGEDFQDVKLVNNTIYGLSKHLRGNSGLYYILMVNLDSKKSSEASVNVSSKESVEDEKVDHKTIVQLEDSSSKSTGFGFKFLLLNNDLVDVEKNNSKFALKKIGFKSSEIDKTKSINNIIE